MHNMIREIKWVNFTQSLSGDKINSSMKVNEIGMILAVVEKQYGFTCETIWGKCS